MTTLKIILGLVLVLFAAGATPAFAAGPYVVDGEFGDWSGAQKVSDKVGDGPNGGDIGYLYWGTNPNENALYFMIERHRDSETDSGQAIDYTVYIDGDNNGGFGDSADRRVTIDYRPQRNGASVTVQILDTEDKLVKRTSGRWGESISSGARRVEAAADFASLGLASRQAIRVYVVANGGDRVPDGGDIQFAPTPILDYPLLIALLITIVGTVWWKKGRMAWQMS